MENKAVIFLKPHANKPECMLFVKDFLKSKGIHIETEVGKVGSEMNKFIDDHYILLSRGALYNQAKDYVVSDAKKESFKDKFGDDWDLAVEEGRVLNSSEFLKRFKLTNEELNEHWENDALEKLVVASGAIVASLKTHESSKEKVYVVNAFYPLFKSKYSSEGSTVTAFVVSFSSPWKQFRDEIIGKTNPEKAKEGSLRKQILDKWEELGLDHKPNYGDNGVHASAGPVEAMRERSLWFSSEISFLEDPFVKLLMDTGGFSEEKIREFMEDTDLFDATEDVDSAEALKLLTEKYK